MESILNRAWEDHSQSSFKTKQTEEIYYNFLGARYKTNEELKEEYRKRGLQVHKARHIVLEDESTIKTKS